MGDCALQIGQPGKNNVRGIYPGIGLALCLARPGREENITPLATCKILNS